MQSEKSGAEGFLSRTRCCVESLVRDRGRGRARQEEYCASLIGRCDYCCFGCRSFELLNARVELPFDYTSLRFCFPRFFLQMFQLTVNEPPNTMSKFLAKTFE